MQPVYGWSGVLGLQAPVLHSTGLRKACTVAISKTELFQDAFNKFMAGSCLFAKQSLTNSDWIKGPGVDRSEIKQEIEDLLQLGVVMCKSAPQGFPIDKARALMDAHLKLKGHCAGGLELDTSEHIVQTTKEVRIHFHTFKDSIASMENLRLKQTVQVTIEIAASKAKDAAMMSHSPLAILIWAFAAKEAGDCHFKLTARKGFIPDDSTNRDVHGTVWEKMKIMLAMEIGLTHIEVEKLVPYLFRNTYASNHAPELVQLHEKALERLKGKAQDIASAMINALHDAKYQLVASDFLAQEREEFMRKQNEVMQQQEEARQKASAVAGDAVVSALEEFKRQSDAAKSDIAELVANLANKPNQTVVLCQGAENTPTNIRIARTRTAILESSGNVNKAHKLLHKEGNGIALSTMYGHIKILNKEDRGWNCGTVSKQLGNLENGVSPRTKGKQRGS
jgi:hypothetical protein